VVVSGGYDMELAWLAGGPGYAGTIVDIVGRRAAVELDGEIELHAGREPWKDFGDGSATALGEQPSARGRWLALALAYQGARWEEPIQRLHVGLCARRPDLGTVPDGGGVGVWVESHATMRPASAEPLA